MSTTQHTPGPWILRPSQFQLPGSYQVTTSGEPLTIGFACHDIPAGEANARLIAAAPELLAALGALVNGRPRISDKANDILSEHCPLVIAARAAIAKAKGAA